MSTRDPGAAGGATAQQVIIGQADAGMDVERISQHHHDVCAELFSGAETAEGERFARGYADAAETLIADLRETERGPEPDRTPGTPHPDPELAARGWAVNASGIYDRAAGREQDREAA